MIVVIPQYLPMALTLVRAHFQRPPESMRRGSGPARIRFLGVRVGRLLE
jgi:hypothetical protein